MGKKDAKERATYFVSVEDHIAIRRTILEALRDILDTMQRFHDFHQLRHQKAHKLSELRMLVNRTNKLIWRLRTGMPEVKLPPMRMPKKAVEEKLEAVAAQRGVAQEAKPRVERKRSELDALEEELAAIEKKLSRLT